VCCNNDKNHNSYRIQRFQIGTELYCLLSNRFDLTTFQICCLYAYRWQIELLFRCRKRTLNGIHLIKNDQQGVTIQFYVLLITALLLHHLKQDVLERLEKDESSQNKVPHYEATNSSNRDTNLDGHQTPTVMELEKHFEQEVPSAYHFLNVLGKHTKKYWKIGIHWLKALISLLAEPFDQKAIKILGEV